MKEKDRIELTEGSRLRITMLENTEKSLVIEGIFRGYVKVGDDYTLHLEVAEEEGKKKKKIMRLVPISSIQFIDVLRLSREKKEKKKKKDMENPLYS